MAIAAAIMVVIGLIQLVVSIGGLIALLGTLKQGRRALREARRTNITAMKAAQIARDSDRAWLVYGGFRSDPTGEGTVDDKPIKRGIQFMMTFKNDGRTPARDVSHYRDFKLVSPADDLPVFTGAEEHVETKSKQRMVAGMAAPSFTAPIVLGDANYDAFLARRVRVAFYAFVRYRDMFHTTWRRTEVCGFIDFMHFAQEPGKLAMPVVSLTLSGTQNTIS